MNFFSLLSFSAFIAYLILGLLALRLDRKSVLNRLFFIFCIASAEWAFSYTFIYTELNKDRIWFWYKLSSIGWCFLPSVILHNLLVLIKKDAFLRKTGFLFLIYLPSAVFINFVFTGYMLTKDFIMTGLGNMEVSNRGSILIWLYPLYFFSFAATGLVLTIIWGENSKLNIEKRQAAIISLSITFFILLGFITDILLPVLDIEIFPSIAHTYGLVYAFFMWYTLSEMKLMIMNPATALETVINNILDVIIITDPFGNIEKVNTAVIQNLGYKKEDLYQKPLGTLFKNEDTVWDLIKTDDENPSMMEWEILCKKKSGETVPFSFYKSLIKNKMNDVLGISLTGRDLRLIKRLESEIQERFEAEKELEKANETLELKVAERTKELELLATIDTMTGVFNRRIGLLLIEKELQRSKRDKTALSVCFVDINNLKHVNDSYGHQEGDELIVQTANFLKESLRESDIICRMGGDEFLFCLPHCTLKQAAGVWSNIQVKIDGYNQTGIKKHIIGVSHGFSETDPAHPKTLDELIAIADKQMYKDKRAAKIVRKKQNENRI